MAARPTARKILAAARRLLDREGAEAVTMRRVGDAVGITAMAIYRHYPDRAALLDALVNGGFTELAAALSSRRLPRSPEARLIAMVDICIDHALAHPRLFELMFLAPRRGARRYPRDFKAGRSPTANVGVAIVKEGMASGLFRDDDPWEITFEIGALIEGLLMLYLGGRVDMTLARFRAMCKRGLRRYLHGIRA